MSWLSGLGGMIGAASAGFGTGAKQDRQTHRRQIRHQTSEREAAEEFSAQQAALQREWSGGESQLDRDFQASEAGIGREFSAQQAKEQMDFQEKMASTQVQRATKDLEKAGLNRILALGQPSAAPSGAMAQSATPSGSRGSGTAASSSGGSSPSGPTGTGPALMQALIQAQTAQSLISKQKEEEDLIRAQKERTDAETVKTKAETGFSELKGMPGNFLKEFLGGEGTAGRQVHDAVRPMINRIKAIDSYLQQQGAKAEKALTNKAKDAITTIRINRGNDAHKHRQEDRR